MRHDDLIAMLPLIGLFVAIVGSSAGIAEVGARRGWRHSRLLAFVIPWSGAALLALIVDHATGPADTLSAELRGMAAFTVGLAFPLAAMAWVHRRLAAARTSTRLAATTTTGLLMSVVGVAVQLYAACMFGAGCI